MKRNSGFSLIELMIAVVIVGIIAAVAIPSYQNSLVKGSRTAAQSFMYNVANREKQYILDARAYASDIATLGMSQPDEVSKFYNTVTIAVSATPPAFTITATPIAGGRQASDGTLTLDSNGNKTPSGKW